jgi:hypothetical protein
VIVVRKHVTHFGAWLALPPRIWYQANYCGSIYVGDSAEEALTQAWADTGGVVPALIFT